MTKQLKPIIHGRDHAPDGADPIPVGLPAGGSYTDWVLALPGLWAYWPLQEASGDAQDLGPADADCEPVGTPAYRVTGPIENDLPYAVRLTAGAPTASVTGDSFRNDPDDLDMPSKDELTVMCWVRPLSTADITWRLPIMATWASAYTGWALYLQETNRQLKWITGTGTAPSVDTLSGPALPDDEWSLVAATLDGTGAAALYVDGSQVAAGTGHNADSLGGIKLGAADFVGAASPGMHFYGDLAGAVWVDSALAPGDILAAWEASNETVGDTEGWVPALDEDGIPVFGPPGVEVEHGGGEPNETHVSYPGSGSFDGPASASGWEYVSHREILVVYDSTPARFDVPSRKWVRVPFNTVRIQRTWETVAGGAFKEAWLPDDRGVTERAKDGVLRVTEDMLFDFGATVPAYPNSDEQWLDGWFTIEYPVLDWTELPMSDPPSSDAYNRAARMVNLRTGQVVSTGAGRAFFVWPFSGEASGGTLGPADAPVDNPYPVYPVWPGRPLTKALPYPQMSPSDSLIYYKTEAGNAGFGPVHTISRVYSGGLVAGDEFVLQAWQDSPWPLRFSTDHFPNFGGFAAVGPWMNQPVLRLEYYYDPETIDHTTGRLL